MRRSTTLGGLAMEKAIEFGDGYRTRRDQLSSSGFRILRAADITDSGILPSGDDYVADQYLPAMGGKVVRTGDVVLTTKGTVGRVTRVGQVSEPMVYSPQVCFFRGLPGGPVANEYLRYWFSSVEFKHQSGHAMHNTDMAPYLSLGDLAKMHVTLPDLDTQRAVAEVLGALDDKIAANRLAAHKASGLAAAVMATISARVELSELVDLERRTIPPASIGPQAWHYSLPAFDGDELPRLENTDSILSAKFLLERPCVLISKLNPRFPRVWAVDNRSGLPALASTEFQPLVPRSITPGVLWSVLTQPSFMEALASQVAGTSGSHQRVSPGDILATEVTDPRGVEPHALRRIDGLVGLAGQLRQETRTLSRVRDTLLPLLMSGQLRVRDAEGAVEGGL